MRTTRRYSDNLALVPIELEEVEDAKAKQTIQKLREAIGAIRS